tara:strand:- start:225 stop:485 length:261 start_codon:yes stop_codon:yes gene_type:complete
MNILHGSVLRATRINKWVGFITDGGAYCLHCIKKAHWVDKNNEPIAMSEFDYPNGFSCECCDYFVKDSGQYIGNYVYQLVNMEIKK